MSIAVINYDAGNTGSIKYALEQFGIASYIAYIPDDLLSASHIILPGVGSFNKAMAVLRDRKLDTAIKYAVLEKNVPILGICLGMQLFATRGYEGGETEGLNLIPGQVRMMIADSNSRLPHVGWNEVHFNKKNLVFSDVPSGSDFYFLHSYHFIAQSEEHIVSNTNYGNNFVSTIAKEKIIGVQFHPEKSGKIGRQLLKNFASL